MDSLCHGRNKMMYVLSWQTVSVLTQVLFWYLFPSLLHNSGYKHPNNPLMRTEIVPSRQYLHYYIEPHYNTTRLYTHAAWLWFPRQQWQSDQHRLDIDPTLVSDQCLIDADLRGFASWVILVWFKLCLWILVIYVTIFFIIASQVVG